MAIVVESLKFFNEFDGGYPSGDSTNFLLGNIGDKVTIEAIVSVDEYFITDGEVGNRIIFNVSPSTVNQPDTSDILFCERAGVFENYQVGDTIKFSFLIQYSSNVSLVTDTFIIYQKIDNQTLRLYVSTEGDVDWAAGGAPQDAVTNKDEYFELATPMRAIDYDYNFVNNNGFSNYNSAIDGQVARFVGSDLDNTDTVTQIPLVQNLPTTNNIGSAYIVGNGTSNSGVGQSFKIVHETIITPLGLANEIDNIANGIAPELYESDNCAKYIAKFIIKSSNTNPNYVQEIEFDGLDSNTGWYNENFNGTQSAYYVNSIQFLKPVTNAIIDAPEVTTEEQTVVLSVRNEGGVFSSATEFCLHFMIMPELQSDYQNNSNDIITNFRYDRGFTDIAALGIAGDNNGTVNQVFTDIDGALDGTEPTKEIDITAKIQFSQEIVDQISASPDVRFIMWVSTEDNTLTPEDSDRVALLAKVDTFTFDFSDPGIVVFDNKFLRHWESDIETEGTTDLIARKEDDILARTRFYIDRLGRESDDISIVSANLSLIAKKTDGSEFTLESFNQSFGGATFIGDTQYIDLTIDRGYNMPDGEQRRSISVKRRTDLDTVDFRYFDILYPFMFRWDYWNQLAISVQDAFDVNEPFNGFNHDWNRYDTLADWDIYYKSEITLNKNGNILVVEDERLLTTFDYLEDVDWINESVTLSSGNILTAGTVATFSMEYAGASLPTIDDVDWVARIEVKEQGGTNGIRLLSSVYDWSEGSWLSSVDASNKVVKDVVGNVFTAQVVVDFDDLPDAAQFDLSARLYDRRDLVGAECCLLLEDGDSILDEGGVDCLAPEDC